MELLELVRNNTLLSTIVFTGFSYEEVQRMPCFKPLARLTDLLIAGRYVEGMLVKTGFTGSAKKTIHYFPAATKQMIWKSSQFLK